MLSGVTYTPCLPTLSEAGAGLAEKYGKTLLLNISKNVTGLLVDVDAWSTGIDVSYPGCVADAEDGEEEGEGEE